ncbi:MAG: peptide-methionine (S)-S-oxide reductase MsrA [Candidatus Paceibacterota bacterium]
MSLTLEKAVFAAGCFWGVEDVFRKTEGVVDTRVGYIGGHTQNPTYSDVCGGDTGHAEAVAVTFDTEKISYKDLLEVFWKLHDPTQHNRQGPDVGTQYRSAIFYRNNAQKEIAEESKNTLALSNTYTQNKNIRTEITKAPEFFEAEEYHQQYVEKNGGGSCAI